MYFSKGLAASFFAILALTSIASCLDGRQFVGGRTSYAAATVAKRVIGRAIHGRQPQTVPGLSVLDLIFGAGTVAGTKNTTSSSNSTIAQPAPEVAPAPTTQTMPQSLADFLAAANAANPAAANPGAAEVAAERNVTLGAGTITVVEEAPTIVVVGEAPPANPVAEPPANEAPKQGAEGIVAVQEAEKFDGNSGITIENGRVSNLGGDLGITKGSDGSVSVGGGSGINISPRQQ